MLSADHPSSLPLSPFASTGLEGSQFYQEVIEAAGVGFCVLEVIFDAGVPVDLLYCKVNSAFGRITGLEDVTGRRVSELIPDLEAYWLRVFARVVEEGGAVQFERQVPQLGRFYSVEAVRLGDARLHRVGVLFFDISRRRQMDAERAESEARFSALADGLPVPVWVLDEQGQLRFSNSAFSRFFGTPPGHHVQPYWWRSLLHPDEQEAFGHGLEKALSEAGELHREVRAQRHDGQWRWLEMSAIPRFSSDGRFIGLSGNSTDVTDRHEVERARAMLLEAERDVRDAAEQMAHRKDDFLATLSHELRTPLTTILGWSELLLQRMEADDPMRRGMEVIASSARVQQRLMSDMLDLGSLLVGKVRLELEVLDLAALVREGVEARRAAAEAKPLELRLHVPEAHCAVLGDAARLRQILENLLANAIKFTPAGGCVEVALLHGQEQYLIEVRDNGDGIVPEYFGRLFNHFSQADSTSTRRHGGLGLGLAIVQQLTELHGGDVSAASAGPGKGSVFRVRLSAYQRRVIPFPRQSFPDSSDDGTALDDGLASPPS